VFYVLAHCDVEVSAFPTQGWRGGSICFENRVLQLHSGMLEDWKVTIVYEMI